MARIPPFGHIEAHIVGDVFWPAAHRPTRRWTAGRQALREFGSQIEATVSPTHPTENGPGRQFERRSVLDRS